jgi:transketolase
MLGDGECQEGEVWEAAMVAARYGLDNLVAIVDHNKLQQYGWPGDGPDGRLAPEEPGELVAKWTAFGWRVLEVDGHNMSAVVDVLQRAGVGDGRPTAVISHTVKGKGVSFMEGHFYWHTRVIKPDEFATAMADLGEPVATTNGGSR